MDIAGPYYTNSHGTTGKRLCYINDVISGISNIDMFGKETYFKLNIGPPFDALAYVPEAFQIKPSPPHPYTPIFSNSNSNLKIYHLILSLSYYF